MGRRYFSRDDQTATGTPGDSVISLESASTVKPRIFESIFGTSGTPADNAMVYTHQRMTASGTGDALTENPLDPDDPAALAACVGNHTAEPTYTADLIMLEVPLNQRATFRWIAAPGGELVLPATAANGIGLVMFHASYTGIYNGVYYWEE